MEIIGLLLEQDRVDMLILAVIFSQCSDASATVRAKAISILGDCIESNHPSMVEMFDIIFGEQGAAAERNKDEEEEEDDDVLDLLQSEEPIVLSPALLPRARELLELLEDRAMDDKVHVRKNALQLLLCIARRHERYLNQKILKLLGGSCRDVALLIRRHMTQMLTELVLEHPDNKMVQQTWARSVLPLVLDGETRVQEKALECAEQLIIKSLTENDGQLGWALLDIITEQGLSAYLSKAVELWARQQQIPSGLSRTLRDNSELRSRAALTLMAIIARHTSIDNSVKVDMLFLIYMLAFSSHLFAFFWFTEICFGVPARPHRIQRSPNCLLPATGLQDLGRFFTFNVKRADSFDTVMGSFIFLKFCCSLMKLLV